MFRTIWIPKFLYKALPITSALIGLIGIMVFERHNDFGLITSTLVACYGIAILIQREQYKENNTRRFNMESFTIAEKYVPKDLLQLVAKTLLKAQSIREESYSKSHYIKTHFIATTEASKLYNLESFWIEIIHNWNIDMWNDARDWAKAIIKSKDITKPQWSPEELAKLYKQRSILSIKDATFNRIPKRLNTPINETRDIKHAITRINSIRQSYIDEELTYDEYIKEMLWMLETQRAVRIQDAKDTLEAKRIQSAKDTLEVFGILV